MMLNSDSVLDGLSELDLSRYYIEAAEFVCMLNTTGAGGKKDSTHLRGDCNGFVKVGQSERLNGLNS